MLRTTIVVLAALVVGAGAAAAEPTRITVRVISKDAKFIGSSMGGALITIRDVETGRILAEGVTAGSTGDTAKIIREPRQRGVPISTKDSAKFDAEIDLDRPRQIEVSAIAPAAQRQSANRVSATQWLIPGKHVTGGDGWVLEMPGMMVDVLNPPAHMGFLGVPQTMALKANVTMMCGCPLEPEGLWDSSKFEIKAIVSRDGALVGEVAMDYAGELSQFGASLAIDKPGLYQITVYAYDPASGNSGLDQTTFSVLE